MKWIVLAGVALGFSGFMAAIIFRDSDYAPHCMLAGIVFTVATVVLAIGNAAIGLAGVGLLIWALLP